MNINASYKIKIFDKICHNISTTKTILPVIAPNFSAFKFHVKKAFRINKLPVLIKMNWPKKQSFVLGPHDISQPNTTV